MIFIPSFKKLSWLNLVGCLSTVLVTLTMILSVGIDAERTKMPVQVCQDLQSAFLLIHRRLPKDRIPLDSNSNDLAKGFLDPFTPKIFQTLAA